jgi:hypothetical protein
LGLGASQHAQRLESVVAVDDLEAAWLVRVAADHQRLVAAGLLDVVQQLAKGGPAHAIGVVRVRRQPR